jgi:hypothetical protein
MSLNFDHSSNLSLVRRFHTMKKIVKMRQFYSDSSRFFFCNQLYNSGDGILATTDISLTNMCE